MDWNDMIPNDEYSEFLRSPEWRALREQVFDRDGRMCVMCKSRNNLRAHHISYADRLNPDYLITLCDKCHSQVHQYTKSFNEALKNEDSELRRGINLINTGITHLIDQHIYSRCFELNPNGDVHFFTGPREQRVNINNFIENLVALDPYGKPSQKGESGFGGYWISHRGRATWTRYNDIRLKRKGWNEL